LLDSFINYQYKTNKNNEVSMDIIKLYNQCKIKLNSSMISYLISNEKINFILYDTDYQLLAIGKYNGSYIHQYGNNNNNNNPYQHESFLKFHSLLTSFYELSLMQCMNENTLQINTMISCFNNCIRSCLSYNNNYTFWTPSINKQEIFKQIINVNNVIKVENIIKYDGLNGYESDESLIQEKEQEDDDNIDIISNCGDLSSSESNCDDYVSDYSISAYESCDECIICCEKVDDDDHDYHHHDDHHIHSKCKHHHKDIHHSCLLKWRQNGNNHCPKCGI